MAGSLNLHHLLLHYGSVYWLLIDTNIQQFPCPCYLIARIEKRSFLLFLPVNFFLSLPLSSDFKKERNILCKHICIKWLWILKSVMDQSCKVLNYVNSCWLRIWRCSALKRMLFSQKKLYVPFFKLRVYHFCTNKNTCPFFFVYPLMALIIQTIRKYRPHKLLIETTLKILCHK